METPSARESNRNALERGVLYAIDTFEKKRAVETTALVETTNEVYMITSNSVQGGASEEMLECFRSAVQEVVDNAKEDVASVTVIAEIKYSVIPHTMVPGVQMPDLRVEGEGPKDGIMVSVEKPDEIRTAIADVARDKTGKRVIGEWSEIEDAFLNGLTGFLRNPSSLHIN